MSLKLEIRINLADILQISKKKALEFFLKSGHKVKRNCYFVQTDLGINRHAQNFSIKNIFNKSFQKNKFSGLSESCLRN